MLPRRIETKSSETASYTCFSRGCATREEDPRFRGPDTMAEMLFPLRARLMLNIAPVRKLIMRKMFPPGLHEYVYARTRVMDEAFTQALDARFAQVVLLGAGFDTRAMRFASRNHGTSIFELDAPTTQKPKLEILRRRKAPLPAALTFAAIDFDHEDIMEVLSRAGYQSGEMDFFLWEGVSMYLSARAVDATLEFIRRSAAPGSRLAFDYILAGVLRQENRYYGEQKGFEMVARLGEGWTFGLEEGQIEPFLYARGFNLITHYTPAELEKRYLTEPDGKLHGRVNETHCIAIAAVQ